MRQKLQWIPVTCFGVLMFGLGASDSLRGIFSPVFGEHFGVDSKALSMMVTISYVGNLLFLSVGGKLLDSFDRKRVAMAMVGVWCFAVLLNLFTDSYPMILISMFLALGASTMLNTTVNLLTPAVCAGYAGLMVNLFFFVQGIGTSGSQFLLGRYAFSFAGWKGVNLLLLLVGIASLVLFAFVRLGNREEAQDNADRRQSASGQDSAAGMPGPQVFWLLCAMVGCYFIGEHGIMNWFLTYCMSAYAMDSGTASTYLSVFWGGMTLGRLIFAPLVQNMGVKRSLKRFGGLGTVLFVLGILLGARGVWLLSLSGLMISILYPTMILFFQTLYPSSVVATRTGAIISIATIADILFNAVFGALTDWCGIRLSFMILPLCMLGFYLLCRRLLQPARRSRARA